MSPSSPTSIEEAEAISLYGYLFDNQYITTTLGSIIGGLTKVLAIAFPLSGSHRKKGNGQNDMQAFEATMTIQPSKPSIPSASTV